MALKLYFYSPQSWLPKQLETKLRLSRIIRVRRAYPRLDDRSERAVRRCRIKALICEEERIEHIENLSAELKLQLLGNRSRFVEREID